VLSLGVGLAAGSAGWWPGDDILWRIRAPRVLAGFGAGAALAFAGALMQLLTRNALADPAVLGVSGGAGVGALLAMLLMPAAGAWLPMAGAALGACAASALLLALSWRVLSSPGGIGTAGEGGVTLLLLGVMIGSASAAAISLMLSLAPQAQLRGMVFWLLGDLNGATQWWPVWLVAAGGLALVLPGAGQLDAMARGDAWSRTLGVPVVRRRRMALVAAALATGAAVATAGAIGFVGLVVPHALRMVGVRAAPALLPASALVGGAFVVAVDTLARTLLAPVQLPVGVFAAAIGVPVFVWLLLKGPGR
jgi:iron complex transport system permease protein